MDTPDKHWLVSTVSTVSISYREESKVVVEVVKKRGRCGGYIGKNMDTLDTLDTVAQPSQKIAYPTCIHLPTWIQKDN